MFHHDCLSIYVLVASLLVPAESRLPLLYPFAVVIGYALTYCVLLAVALLHYCCMPISAALKNCTACQRDHYIHAPRLCL